jgi:hypothetical protein
LFNSKRIGLIAAFFQSINGLAIELAAGRCATDHIDTFFLFFIQLSIVFILLDKKYNHKKFLILQEWIGNFVQVAACLNRHAIVFYIEL